MNFESIKYILLSSIYILRACRQKRNQKQECLNIHSLLNPETTLRIEEKTVSD